MLVVVSAINVRPLQNPTPAKAFSHPAEAEFARLLDLYGIPWIYEPTTFPLAIDADGNITEGLTPDFFLPSENLYFELTHRLQSNLTELNRKIRILKEMYPFVRIKLLNRRNMHSLFARYGVEADQLAQIGKAG